jgi:4-amino-4-deoxy-L-arabinose transferase-like glycosyltransferase
VLLLAAAFLAVALPPLAADVLRAVNGEGFLLVAGRFLLPAHACVAVLLVLALRELVPARILPWTCGALVAAAAAFCWTVYWDTYVHRYFGDGSTQELFRRMSFDRPEFVTPVTYTLALAALVGCLAAAFAVVVKGTRRTAVLRRSDTGPAVGTTGA